MGKDFYVQDQLDTGECLEIRNASATDGAAYSRLLHRCGCETDNLSFGAEDCPYSESFSRSYLEQLNAASGSLALLAILNGELVGEITLTAQPRRFSHTAELGICVVQECCGRGIGTRLMNAALSWAQQSQQLHSIFLAVDRENEGAIRLYKRYGFAEYGCYEANSYYKGEYHDTVFMNLFF